MRNNLPKEGLIKYLKRKGFVYYHILTKYLTVRSVGCFGGVSLQWRCTKHLLCSATAAGRSDQIVKLETFLDLNVQKTKHIGSFLPSPSVSSFFFNKNSQPVITINSCRQFRVLIQLTCITLCGWKLMWIQRRKYY